MALPNLPGRALIAKGMFAVSVVAVTATVGIVSFAQAARPLDNGYGGNGYGGGVGAILAAIQEFQNTVHDATQQFNNDINACLAGVQQDMNVRGTSHQPAVQNTFNTSADTFKQQANSSIGQFSSQFANPSSVTKHQKQLENKLNSAVDTQDKKLDASATQLSTALDRVDSNRNSGALRQCLNTARRTFRQTIQDAQAKLRAAIHNAFH
jgi:hypothetical protein